METKKCSKCGEVKILSEFGKRNGNTCKKCMCLSSENWYKNNKEKRKQYNKERYENNKEKAKQSSKEWNENNKEKAKQNHKGWRENNKEKVKQYNEKVREDCHPSYITYHLKKQGFNKEQITPELIEEKANIIKVKRIIYKINKSIN